MLVAKRTPMMEQYEEIKQTCEDALLFFRLGDFYELFNEDAIKASELLDLTLTGRGTGEQRMPMCGVPYHAADNYISRLVGKGYKVAICEQVEDPKLAKGLVKREIIRLITPGTAHDYIRQDTYRPLIATFGQTETGKLTGIIADALTGNIWIKTGGYPTLSNWFNRMQVAEVVGDEHGNYERTQQLKEYAVAAEVTYSHIPNDLFVPPVPRDSGSQLLMRYLEYTRKHSLDHMKRPKTLDEDRFMELTANTVRHLELIRPTNDERKRATLFETLDFTCNVMGRRRLREMLEHPLREVSSIVQRQDMIMTLLNEPVVMEELRNLLKRLHDLTRIVSRISFDQATPRDLWQLAESLEIVRFLREQLQTTSLDTAFGEITEDMYECVPLVEQIRAVLSEDVRDSVKDGSLIKSGANQEIDRLREIVNGGRSHILALEQSERLRTGIKSLKVGYNRVFGYYIEVTSANLHLVPDDYERKQTLSTAERYVTKELREREFEIAQAGEKQKELELELFSDLIVTARVHLRLIQQTADAIGELDALVGLATAAKRYHYVRPIVDDSRVIHIVSGRHPVVERHTTGGFVENDVHLSCDARQIALITGPNMGGKSTYMRQTALIVIMAQIGSFVPASSAQIGVVDKLFTRIGASDDVTAGLSTFMVEMTESAEILDGATEQSLLLFDEIGRGTATYDGMSIAEALVEYVHDYTGARSLFATHYHELTELPRRLPRVFNLSVAVKEHGDQIVFLHRVVERSADRSYGIQVAQKAGLPRSVTERARHILLNLERSMEEAVASTQQIAIAFSREASLEQRAGEELIAELRDLTLEEWTPRQAISYLFELQERVKKGTNYGIDPRT